MQDGKKALLVLGMHRSGTSAVTGALSCLGVDLGRRLYPPQSGVNEKGFFEHSTIADTDDEVLWTMGSSWDDVLPLKDRWWLDEALAPLEARIGRVIRRDFGRTALWGLKDPRLCRLLPWWQRVLGHLGVDVVYVIAFRHPIEVAGSLKKRDRFGLEKSLLLWIDHNLSAERWTRDQKRVFVMYENFLANPRGEIERMEREVGVRFPVPMEQGLKCVDKFLSVDMRHHRTAEQRLEGGPLGDIADDVMRRFTRAAVGEIAAVETAAMDQLRSSFLEYLDEFAPVLAEHTRAVARHRAELQLTVDRVFSSWWWTVGKPLRALERLIRRPF